MELIKYTRPKYVTEAVSKGRIKLGSFREYHLIAGPGQDAHEGMPYSLGDENIATNISMEKFNEIAKVTGSPFRLEGNWSFTQGPGAHLLMGPLFNTLIFSCSTCDEIDEELKARFGGGHYFIRDQDEFAQIVKQAIHIKFASMRRHGESDYDPATMQLNYLAEPVKYVDSKKPVAISDADHIERKISLASLFQKTRDYQDEREFRFVFFFKNRNTGSVANLGFDKLIITSRKLKKVLSRS